MKRPSKRRLGPDLLKQIGEQLSVLELTFKSAGPERCFAIEDLGGGAAKLIGQETSWMGPADLLLSILVSTRATVFDVASLEERVDAARKYLVMCLAQNKALIQKPHIRPPFASAA